MLMEVQLIKNLKEILSNCALISHVCKAYKEGKIKLIIKLLLIGYISKLKKIQINKNLKKIINWINFFLIKKFLHIKKN